MKNQSANLTNHCPCLLVKIVLISAWLLPVLRTPLASSWSAIFSLKPGTLRISCTQLETFDFLSRLHCLNQELQLILYLDATKLVAFFCYSVSQFPAQLWIAELNSYPSRKSAHSPVHGKRQIDCCVVSWGRVVDFWIWALILFFPFANYANVHRVCCT